MHTHPRLILKSGSPRRIQILKDLGLRFESRPPEITETCIPGESPPDYLKRITLGKLEIPECKGDFVYISSDTIVVLDGEIYFKPADKTDALRIIMELSGKTHEVLSGLGIYCNGEIFYDFDRTFVTFKDWNTKNAKNYIEKFIPLDKAGSYGIQDPKGPVAGFKGSYSNVIGMPLRKFYKYYEIWQNFL